MKKTFILITVLLSLSSVAQPPQNINYQAIARNSQGAALANQAIKIRLTIKTLTANGNTLYQEITTDTTNQFGLFNALIGAGTVTSGSFSAINWTMGNKYLQVEFDPNGGNTFTDMGTTQFVTVPFSFYAGKADTASIAQFLGAERIERLSVDGTCTATPCTITRQSNNWISSIDRISVGFYKINFIPGIFSETPTCICSGGPANGRSAEIFSYSGTSYIQLKTMDPAIAMQDQPFQLICMGKH